MSVYQLSSWYSQRQEQGIGFSVTEVIDKWSLAALWVLRLKHRFYGRINSALNH